MEEGDFRDLDAVHKVGEMDGGWVIISDKLTHLLLLKFPILLAPFPSSPCVLESPANQGIR